jgi:hypothetical protein
MSGAQREDSALICRFLVAMSFQDPQADEFLVRTREIMLPSNKLTTPITGILCRIGYARDFDPLGAWH